MRISTHIEASVRDLLREILASHTAPASPLGQCTLRQFLADYRPPRGDRHTTAQFEPIEADAELQEVAEIIGASEVRNAIVYPAGSCMAWHTNSDVPGVRRYYTYSAEGGGIFRYQDPATGQIIDSIDRPGWMVREFDIPDGELFWHTIYAPFERWSFGFLMPR